MAALEMETGRQEFIGHMIMWVLDLYLEGVVPVADDDLITARINYLCEKYPFQCERVAVIPQRSALYRTTV